MIYDCNTCAHLNITEKEQTDKRIGHVCLVYKKRLYHKCFTNPHDDYIYPCNDCKRDKYQWFKKRK